MGDDRVNRLKDLREDKDLFQKDISRILKMDQSNYSKYELEKINIPVEVLKSLAIFYNTSIDYIVGITNIKEPYPRKKEKDL